MTTVDADLKAAWAALGIECPPTEDELPYSDGMPMESERHVAQSYLLLLPLRQYWSGRDDAYAAIDMFVYFCSANEGSGLRGPDFFAAVGVTKRERKSWVVWQEARDRMSRSSCSRTAPADRQGEKMVAYQDQPAYRVLLV
jgi:Uma2 family endonuclease